VFFNIILCIVAVLSIIGIFFYGKKQGDPKAKLIAISLFVVALASIFVFSIRSMQGGSTSSAVTQLDYVKASGFGLAKKLAEKYSGGKVLLVTNSPDPENENRNSFIEGFKEGLGDSMKKLEIAAPHVTPPYSLGPNPDEMMKCIDVRTYMTAEDINKLISKNRDCNIIVMSVGLPVNNLGDLNFFKNSSKRPVVAVIGDNSTYLPFVKEGYISYQVISKPGFEIPENDSTSDLKLLFNKAYLLVDKGNVSGIMTQFKKSSR
jgi:hypothetical protein